MREEPNGNAFCRALRERGLSLLDSVDDRLRGILDHHLRRSDICSSESITSDLESAWDDGPEPAVQAALESYLHVMREWLEGVLGPDSLFPWSRTEVSDELRWELYYAVDLIQLRQAPDAVAALASAASEPEESQSAEPDAAPDSGGL